MYYELGVLRPWAEYAPKLIALWQYLISSRQYVLCNAIDLQKTDLPSLEAVSPNFTWNLLSVNTALLKTHWHVSAQLDATRRNEETTYAERHRKRKKQ